MNDMTDTLAGTALPGLRIAETERGRISFREAGSGPTLVLLHGMNGSSKSWVYQLRAFSTVYRVIAWDAPGYGKSDPVAPDADAYAAQVESLLNFLKVDRAAVVAHSMGGVVAERFCARHPGRASSLVLSGTHWGNAAPPEAPLAAKYERRLQELEMLSAKEYGEARAQKMMPASSSREAFDQIAQIASEATRAGLLGAGQMVEKADNRPFLPSLKLPVLIITGDSDTVVVPERSQAMLDFLSDARSVSIPGVGHAAYVEAPEKFNRIVEQFLRDRAT